MMMSPKMYIKDLENKSYEELLIEKDELINDIKKYENGEVVDSFKPSGGTIYKMHLQYLAELCLLIVNKCNK